MKQLACAFLLVLLSTTLLNAQGDLKKKADEAYKNNDYTLAVSLYNQILEDGSESHEVYYNLGCAYYRMDKLGSAIVCFERAKRLKPNDKATAENLALAYRRTKDQIKPMPELWITRFWRSITHSLLPSTWFGILLVMILVFVSAVIWFLVSCDIKQRRLTLLASLVIFVVTAAIAVCAVGSSHAYNTHNEAVVMSQSCSAKSSPNTDGAERFLLHEGTKVDIQESIDNWYQIRLADGNTGWVSAYEVQVI